MKKYQLKTPVEATMTRERVLIYRDSVSEELVMPREVFDDLFVEVTEETPDWKESREDLDPEIETLIGDNLEDLI